MYNKNMEIVIVSVVLALIIQNVLSYKERIAMAKINKATSLNEYQYSEVKLPPEKIIKDNLVGLEDIPDFDGEEIDQSGV